MQWFSGKPWVSRNGKIQKLTSFVGSALSGGFFQHVPPVCATIFQHVHVCVCVCHGICFPQPFEGLKVWVGMPPPKRGGLRL